MPLVPWRAKYLDTVNLAHIVLQIGAVVRKALLQFEVLLHLGRVEAPVMMLVKLGVHQDIMIACPRPYLSALSFM